MYWASMPNLTVFVPLPSALILVSVCEAIQPVNSTNAKMATIARFNHRFMGYSFDNYSERRGIIDVGLSLVYMVIRQLNPLSAML
jgi:hypothetical protein